MQKSGIALKYRFFKLKHKHHIGSVSENFPGNVKLAYFSFDLFFGYFKGFGYRASLLKIHYRITGIYGIGLIAVDHRGVSVLYGGFDGIGYEGQWGIRKFACKGFGGKVFQTCFYSLFGSGEGYALKLVRLSQRYVPASHGGAGEEGGEISGFAGYGGGKGKKLVEIGRLGG